MASEDLNEHEAGDMPENYDPLQNEGSENDSKGGEGKKWPGWPGENVFRMLVPILKVGGIIGRKGEFIKKITEETKARIKILDGPPGTSERAVSFFSLYLFLVGFIPIYAYCICFLLCHSWLSKLSIN
jgi:hypothetical protein